MQVYRCDQSGEDVRRANNLTLLRQVRAMGGGYAAEQGETADELHRIRSERDERNTDS